MSSAKERVEEIKRKSGVLGEHVGGIMWDILTFVKPELLQVGPYPTSKEKKQPSPVSQDKPQG